MAATFGYLNVIKRSGKDGSRFPLTEDCLIGSGLHCDIRIHLDNVATEHCLIKCQEGGKCLLMNLSKHTTTKLNNNDVTEDAVLHHDDIIGVSDRQFRWEYEVPQVSPVKKPTVTLLSHMSDDMGPSKRLVAVVSPQIREKHDTSQSLRTWVLRRSVGNSLSSRRQPTRTAEDRRSTSLVKIYAHDSDEPAALVNKTPHSGNLSRRTSVASSMKKSLLKVTPHLRKSGGVSTVKTIDSETPLPTTSAMHSSVPDLVEPPVSKTPRLTASRVSYSVTPLSRKSKLTQMEKPSHNVASFTKTPNAEETVGVSPPRRSYRKDTMEVSSFDKSTNATPEVKFLGEQTTQFTEVHIVQDSAQSAVLDNTTPQSVNLSRCTSVKNTVEKSLLKVTPHLRKSGRVSTVEIVGRETSHSMKVDTPVSKTPRLKNSRASYTVTPRSRKSNLTKMEKRSHSMASFMKTPNAEETVEVSSPRRSYRKDITEVSSFDKSTNATPDVKFLGEQTTQFTEVQNVEDSVQSAVLDSTTPQSMNLSRRTSVKNTVEKSLKITPHLRKSGRVSTVEIIGSETPHSMKSTMRGSVLDLVDAPVSKTPRLKNSRASYTVTPRSRKSNLTKMEKRSHSMASTTPNTEKTSLIPSPRKSYGKDSCGVSSSVTPTNDTPEVKVIGGMTTVQSPDLFSSDQVSVIRETVTSKELKKSTPTLTERPKRKSAGLLLAHIRESQELFSRSRRNSTPSANNNKINTKSGRASMVMPKKSKLSFTPLSQSKTPRKLKSLRAMSAKAAKRRLTDVDLSEIAANKLKAESPKTPDKKKMAALLQCHKPRMLFSEVVKKMPVKKTPVKKNVAKVPSVPVIRRRKVPRKPKVHTPKKPPVKGINSTGHIDSPETIIIHGKQSMAMKRPIQKMKEESESQTTKPTVSNLEQVKGIDTSVSVRELTREMNTRKSVSFSPAPQVVAFAASRRISTRKSLKIPNISEETRGTLSPSSELSLEAQPNKKTSILKKPSSAETHVELGESNSISSTVTNVESIHSRSSVVSSTPVRVSERHKGRTSSQSQSTPKMSDKTGKSSRSIPHQSPETLNTSIVSQASTTFDFDAVTTPRISVEKLVSPLNTTSSKKQRNTDSVRSNVNISAQQIFKDLVADKVIDISKWPDPDVNVATSARHGMDAEALAMSSGKKHNRRSVSFPINRYTTRRSQGKRSSGEVFASSNKTIPKLSPRDMAQTLPKNKVSTSLTIDPCSNMNEPEQLSGRAIEDSPKLNRNSGWMHRKSQQSAISHVTVIEDAKKDLRSRESFSGDALLNKGDIKQQSVSLIKRKSTLNDLTDVGGVRRLFGVVNKEGSPLNDLTDVRGVKQLLKSPKPQKSPRNDLTDVRGVKQLLKTPRMQKSPKNDLTDVRGVKRLLRSSLKHKSPKNDLTDVRGVKRLLKSPFQQQKSPENDLTDVRGVKRLFRSTEKQASPKNDLTDVRGVRRLLQSPGHKKSPLNDLTDVRGVKQLLQPTRPQKSPRNDLTDVRGVKQILGSPRVQKSPDNDLTDVRGVKELFRSTRKRRSPENDLDLSDLMGVSSLFSSPQQEVNKYVAVATAANEDATAIQETNIQLGTKRRKYNLKEKETNNSSEEIVSANSYPTRGKRAKKEISNDPDVADLHSIEKLKTVKDKLSQKNAMPSTDVELESHKNSSPPRTRRGKVKVIAEDITVSDEKKLNPDPANNLEQRDLLILSSTVHSSPSITNSPRTRRTKKQVVMEQFIASNLASSSDSTSSPRTRRGKKASEEVRESTSIVETVFETKELFALPIQLPSLDTVPSPRTRRGKKQTVTNQKVKGEILQLPDELQKPDKGGLTKTSQFVSAGTVSPLKTRRGKKYVEKNKDNNEGLDTDTVSHSSKLQTEVETEKLSQNSQPEIHSVNDSEVASLTDAPKIRSGKKGNIALQQRSKDLSSLPNEDIHDSKESDSVSLKPQQKRVIFADVIQVSSPSNSSSPRARRGRKQVVFNEEVEQHGLKANNQVLPDDQDKPLGTRSQRKGVNAASAECSSSSIINQTRTRRGRKTHTTEEILPLKGPNNRHDETDETTPTEESKQNKVHNDSDSVVSPVKPRRGRKVGAITVSSTADSKEETGVINAVKNSVATVSHTSSKGIKSNTPDVPDLTSSKRTLRGKKENATQVTVNTGVQADTGEIEEKKGVKSTRTGRKRGINLEIDTSVKSTETSSSKDAAINNSPPKRSQRGKSHVNKEEEKQSPVSDMMKRGGGQIETESVSDSIENRLQGLAQRTRQTTVSAASKIIDPPDEGGEEKISSRRRGVRQQKKDTNKNEEPERNESTGETVQRSTRSKRKQVQETDEESPKKKKKTQSDRLLGAGDVSKVVSPRATRQRRNLCA